MLLAGKIVMGIMQDREMQQPKVSEPRLVCRKPHRLNRMEHHKQNDEQISPESARTCRSAGSR